MALRVAQLRETVRARRALALSRRRREREGQRHERRDIVRDALAAVSYLSSQGELIRDADAAGGSDSSSDDDDDDEDQGVENNRLLHMDGVLTQARAAISRSTHIPSSARLHRNVQRLTHYIEESNTGRGFIKEVSFSPDGKILCSPHGNGLRLLSFDEGCSDLAACVPTAPRELHRLGTLSDCHDSCVLATAFSPHHFTIVSGAKGGSIVWHEPRP